MSMISHHLFTHNPISSTFTALHSAAAAEPFLAEDLISVAVEACPELGDAFVGDYSTLAAILRTLADRDTAILPETPELEGKAFFVLAPTDKAFENFFEELNTTKEGLLEDTDRLSRLVKRHVSIIENATWTGNLDSLIALDDSYFDLKNVAFVTGPNSTRAKYVSVDEVCKDSPQVVFNGMDTVFLPYWPSSSPSISTAPRPPQIIPAEKVSDTDLPEVEAIWREREKDIVEVMSDPISANLTATTASLPLSFLCAWKTFLYTGAAPDYWAVTLDDESLPPTYNVAIFNEYKLLQLSVFDYGVAKFGCQAQATALCDVGPDISQELKNNGTMPGCPPACDGYFKACNEKCAREGTIFTEAFCTEGSEMTYEEMGEGSWPGSFEAYCSCALPDVSLPEASSFGSAVKVGLIFSLMVATLVMI
jgi:hypothetical protein